MPAGDLPDDEPVALVGDEEGLEDLLVLVAEVAVERFGLVDGEVGQVGGADPGGRLERGRSLGADCET